MKKITTIILVMALMAALCGCGSLNNLKNVELPPLPDANAQQTEPSPEVTAEIDTTNSIPESALPQHVIVSMEKHSEEHYDPQNGDTLILSFSYETPRVYIEGRPEASNAVNEYIATVDETYYTGNDYGIGEGSGDYAMSGLNGMLEMATDNYSYAVENGVTDMPLEFSSSRTGRVERIDSRVLSMVYTTYTFTGGVHGSYFDTGYTFDTESGEYVTLDMLSGSADELKAFLADYMMGLYTSDKDGYYSERVFADMIPDGDVNAAIAALVRDGSWYFNEDGMVIYSSVYELGPYAAGIVDFVIPYSDLAGHIDDKWLPAERTAEGGSLTLKAQSDIADGSIEIIDKVTVDAEGEALCLEAEGTVYDVRLASVDYSDRFYETAQLWACSYMSDCVLQLDTMIPDGMPDLMVSFRDASGAQTRLLLTQSGENGAYILMNDSDIEAVG